MPEGTHRRRLLRDEDRGCGPVPRDDTRAWNFVLGDDAGHEVDFHVIVLDEHGRGQYGPPENGESYPAEALAGTGTVEGRTVDCITPEWLVRFHTGYEVDVDVEMHHHLLIAGTGGPGGRHKLGPARRS